MGEHQHEQIKDPSKTEVPRQAGEASTRRTAQTMRIAAAPGADFGDLMVDETAFREIHIFNQDRDLAFLEAHIEGGDAFQITSKPTHVNPSATGFDPSSAIRIAYMSRSRKVDRGFLIATLRWRDGTSESVRVALQGAAHRSNELTQVDEQAQNAAAEEKQREATEREHEAQQEEQRIRAERAKGGSYERPITDASETLAIELDNLFDKQGVGVTEATARVARYQRRPPPAPAPDVVKELALLAMNAASGGLVSLLATGINAAGSGWTEPRRVGGGLRRKAQATSGSKEVAVTGNSLLGFVASKLLAHATTAKTAAPEAQDDVGRSSAAESRDDQISYFALQGEIVSDKRRATKENAIELRRSLIELDNPTDAPKAEAILNKASAALRMHQNAARTLQAAESMKGWIRHVSHGALGSVSGDDSKRHGLKSGDGTLAHIGQAHAARPYDGVIELEFDADANHAGRSVNVTAARLFGVATAVAASLQLPNRALRTAGLPIRARSSASSTPVHVSIARDEAGNVRFTDESGAPGMPSRWLSRRGGAAASESAAQRAASNLIEDLAMKTLTQLGVTLETDGTDV